MPWNDNSQGPWGGGNSPWGQGPKNNGGGGRNEPPGLDDLMNEISKRFGGGLPGGFGGFRGILAVILVVVAGWMLTGFYRVQPDEQGVVLRFGQYVATSGPGLHYHLPYPIEEVFTPKVTMVNWTDVGLNVFGDSARLNTSESRMVTRDANIVDINFSVFWRIKDASNYLFQIADPIASVKAVAESVMREVIGREDLEPILTEGRQRAEVQARTLMQNFLDEYKSGIEITQIQLTKVDPPAEVIDAFRDVEAARQDQERLRNEADAYKNKVIPEARGDAEKIKQEAEAYSNRVVAEANGEAERFNKILQEYALAPGVTRERIYLETLETVLKSTNKIILEQGQNGQQVLPFLPLDSLNRSTNTQGRGQ
jgi:membrane protease subunit HflK